MSKLLPLLLFLGMAGAFAAPVPPQVYHPEFDTLDCHSWGGDRPTNSWTKCPGPKPVVVEVQGPERIIYQEVEPPPKVKAPPPRKLPPKKKVRE